MDCIMLELQIYLQILYYKFYTQAYSKSKLSARLKAQCKTQWYHDMDTIFILLALCAQKIPVAFKAQKLVMQMISLLSAWISF